MERCMVCGEQRVRPDPLAEGIYCCGYCGMRYRIGDLPALRAGGTVPGAAEKFAELVRTGYAECKARRFETAEAIFRCLMGAHPELPDGWWGMLTVLSKDFDPLRLAAGRTSKRELREFAALLEKCGPLLSGEQLELAERFRACAEARYDSYEKKAAGFAALKELRAHPDDEQYIRRHRRAADAYHDALEHCRELESWLKEAYLQRNGELPKT